MSILSSLFKPNVGKLAETKNIEGLIKALYYTKDPSIQRAAVDAIARIKSKDAFDGLIQALEVNDSYVRTKAIEELGEFKDSSAVTPIINTVETDYSHDFAMMISAVTSLGKIGDSKAVDALFRLMKKNKNTNQKKLRKVLVDALVHINNKKVKKGLIEALKNKNGGVRKEAERGLREIMEENEVDALVDESKEYISMKLEKEKIAAEKKAKRKSAKKIISLINSLEDDLEDHEMYFVLEELGNLRAVQAIKPIIDAVCEGRISDFSASDVLKKIDPAKASEMLRNKIVSYTLDRADLANMLVALNDVSAVPLLKKYLDRGDFSHVSWGHIANFIEAHPEVKTWEEKERCSICHKEKSVTRMKTAQDNWFCSDTCWKKRGTVLSTGIGTDCPMFNDGLCSAGSGDNLCSLQHGHYSTDCYFFTSQ